jgi:hypothetical protein
VKSEMRFLAGSPAGYQGANPLGDLIGRAMMETGGWSIEAMRAPGMRAMEQAVQEERAFRAFQAQSGQFRTAAPLIDKAQVVIDKAVVEVGLQRLALAKYILARPELVYNLNDPLSVTQLEWYTRSRTGAAQRTMNPQSRTESKLPIMLPYRLPIYLTLDGFQLDIRTLKMSERVGMPLDVTEAGSCTRSVNEGIEDATINGATTLDGQALQDAGYTAPGILNATNANTTTLTLAAWTQATANGGTVFADVEKMIGILQTDLKFGPYVLVVGTAIGNVLDADYTITGQTATAGATIRERLLKISTLSDVVIADMMPATKAVLIQMTPDVIQMVNGQYPTVIPWTSLDGFAFFNLVMAIMVPWVKSDANGNSGIVVGTLT